MINWKVRLQSGPFWVGAVSLAVTFTYAVLNLFGLTPEFTQNEAVNVIILLLQLLAFIGVITDPTTKGLSDSKQAMGYAEPKNDKK